MTDRKKQAEIKITLKEKLVNRIQALSKHNRAELLILCRNKHIRTINTDRKNDLITKILQNDFIKLKIR